jgi:hypothetical protein
MKKDITILEFPLNLGLTKKEHEIETGVRKLPAWLRKFGFHKGINLISWILIMIQKGFIPNLSLKI